MRLTVGSKIVYPSQGPCLICAIVEKAIDQQPRMFYKLRVLNSGGDLFIPVEKADAVGIRRLLNVSEIPELLDHLSRPVAIVDNYRQRHLHILKLFSSGLAFDLAEIVGSLTEVHRSRSLSFGEHKTLEKAKGLLVSEIAEATGATAGAATEQIETALAARAASAQARGRRAATRDHLRYQAVTG